MKPLPVLLLIVAGGSATFIRPSREPIATPASYTTPWSDSSTLGGTTFYSKGRVVTSVAVYTDSVWAAQPSVTTGMPFGPTQLPPDSLCTLDYTGTTLPVVPARVVGDLERTRECGGRIIPQIRRIKLKDSAGNLSVESARAELATWPWPDLCLRVKDSTILAIHIGDDVTAKEWGPDPLATRLARWDTIAGLVRAKCPEAPVVIRALPTQLETRPNWQWLTTGWAQYPGPRPRWGPPEKFYSSQVASARKQKLGLVAGINLINGGCGPIERGLCLDGVPGTTLTGTRPDLFQVSAEEMIYYKTVAMSDPYVCASFDWGWGPAFRSDVHSRPEIWNAAKALGIIARQRPRGSCAVR